MTTELYATAQRVFWIVDNGSSHAGKRSADRLQAAWLNLILVHLPVHASSLNKIEIYFSTLQRQALTPRHFRNLDELADQITTSEPISKRPPNRSTGATRADTSTNSWTASHNAINTRTPPERTCVNAH